MFSTAVSLPERPAHVVQITSAAWEIAAAGQDKGDQEQQQSMEEPHRYGIAECCSSGEVMLYQQDPSLYRYRFYV